LQSVSFLIFAFLLKNVTHCEIIELAGEGAYRLEIRKDKK